MNYVQFHLGDWLAGTALLSPTERGVYMDLLVRYYKEERPIMQEECKRIARAYAPHEQEAMQYVLQTFFTLDAEGYHHARCDAEIAKAQEVSEKRKKSANARWSKKETNKKAVVEEQEESKQDASAMQVHSGCNANGMLTNNHKPITNNQVSKEKVEKENLELVNLVSEPAEPEKTKKATKPRKKPVTSCPFTSDDEIPSEYLALKDKYPDVNVIAEFSNFVNFHTSKGNQFADWLAAFRNWLNKAKQYASERKSNVANRGFSKSQKTPGFGVLLESDPSDPSTYDQTAIDEVYRRSAERLDMANIDDTDVPF